MAASPSKRKKTTPQKAESGQRQVKKPTIVKKNVQKAAFKRPCAAQQPNKADEDKAEEGKSASEGNAADEEGKPAPVQPQLNVGLTDEVAETICSNAAERRAAFGRLKTALDKNQGANAGEALAIYNALNEVTVHKDSKKRDFLKKWLIDPSFVALQKNWWPQAPPKQRGL